MSPPTTILLATDLSARSDRAMDRAAQVMAQRGARLVVVHVLDPATPTKLTARELAERARRELADQLRDAGERVVIRVERGEPVAEIRRVAREEGGSLVIAGVARNETFGRVRLGDTVEGLLRGLESPLLVVTGRAKASYRRITVAVDFSEASRGALRAAAGLFPDLPLTVFHAHAALGSYGASDLEAYREAHGAIAAATLRDFVAATALPDAVRARLAYEVQFGDPALQLGGWTEANEIELVVLGTHARGRLGELFLGSVAKRVLASLSCDALLVPARDA